MVGARSARRPSPSEALPPPASSTGTGLVVCEVCGPPVTGSRINLAIAVVGGDQERAAGLRNRIGDFAEAGVGRLHRLDGGGKAPGVADHVGIGEVQNDHVVFAGADRLDRLGGEFGRRHLGLQVVGRDLGRRHHDAVLALVGLLAAAVEEVGDVRIFFRFGHAQLRAAGVGHHLAEDVREALRRKDRLHQPVEIVAVLCHAGRRGEFDFALAREAGEIRIEHGAEDFAYPVGAEVEAQQAVAVLDPAIAADHRRHDELVELLFCVGIIDGRLRVWKARALGFDDGVVGFGDALPALVAVHRVIAPDHGGDRNGLRQRGGEPFQVVAGRLRRRIAAVGDGMSDGRHPRIGQEFRQRRGVVLMRIPLEKIGEPFYSLKENGTGLGLMVCHRIIEAHKGKILIKSQLNQGTTLEIELPLGIADSDETAEFNPN